MTLNPNVFELVSPYQPAGDQPAAIEALVRGIQVQSVRVELQLVMSLLVF